MKPRPFLLLLLSLLHLVACYLGGAFGWQWQTIIVTSFTAIAMALINRWLKFSTWIALLCVLPFFLSFIAVTAMVDEEPPVWIYWTGGLLTAIAVFLLLHFKVRAMLAAGVLATWIFLLSFFVYPNLFAWIYSDRQPEARNVFAAKLVDDKGTSVPADSLRGKVVLLDIWHSRCYNCIKQFPELQGIYESYRQDPAVKVFALNIPMPDDSSKHPARFTDPYQFGKLYFADSVEYHRFAKEALPLTLVLDKNGVCRYAGQLNTEWNVYVGNIRRVINQLKDE